MFLLAVVTVWLVWVLWRRDGTGAKRPASSDGSLGPSRLESFPPGTVIRTQLGTDLTLTEAWPVDELLDTLMEIEAL